MLEVDSLFDDLAQTVCKGRVADFLRFFRLVNQGEMASEMEYLVHLEKCPKCAAEFKYIAFRNVKAHLHKMIKLAEQRPSITMVSDFPEP